MTLRRHLAALAVAGALAAGASAGCGSDDEPADSGESGSEQTTTESQPTGGY
jgi:hypothetical protein